MSCDKGPIYCIGRRNKAKSPSILAQHQDAIRLCGDTWQAEIKILEGFQGKHPTKLNVAGNWSAMAKACMILRVKCINLLGRGLGRQSRARLRARAALPI